MIGIEPLSGLQGLNDPSSPFSKRPVFRQPLPDEQFQSLGQKALNSGLGALQYIGGTIAKPGNAVRGVLSGRASALKNLIPFSDSLGITNEADHTSGRDLSNQWGLTRKSDQGWGAWGIGLALDFATDPLTYIGGIGPKSSMTHLGEEAFKKGALRNWTGRHLLEGFTDTEKGLRNAGYGDQIIEHLRDQGLNRRRIAPENITAEGGAPLAGLAKFGIPGGPHVVVGTGPLAQKIAGVADTLGDKLKYGNKLSRGLNALFDPAVGGSTDEATQRAAAMYRAPVIRAQKAQNRFEKHDLLAALDPLISAAPEKEQIITQAARHAAEGGPAGITPNLTPEMMASVQPAARVINAASNRIKEEMIARGINRDLADQFGNYVPRQSTKAAGSGPQVNAKNSGLFPTASGSSIKRKSLYRDIPGMSARIDDWYKRFAGSDLSSKDIAASILEDMTRDATTGGHVITPEMQQGFVKKANQFGRRLRRTKPEYQTKPFISPDIEADLSRRGTQHAYSMGNQAALVGGLADVAEPYTEGLTKLGDIIAKSGLRTTRAAEGQPLRGGLVDIHKALARQGMGMSDYLGTEKELLEAVNRYGVDPKHAEAFLRPYERPQIGEALKGPVGILDSFNNAFKALAYPLFPASHARNIATATLNNAIVGAKPWETVQAGIMRGTTPEAQAARRAQYGYAGIFEPERGAAHEVSGGIKKGLLSGERFTSGVPGEGVAGPTGTILGDTANLVGNEGLMAGGRAFGKAASGSVDELLHRRGDLGQAVAQNLGIRGVGGLERDTNPLIGAARKVSSNIENYFRGQMYESLTKRGYSPEMAAEMIDKYHFNYSDRTPFSKNVVSRVMPFATYMQKNLPLQLETLTRNPRVIQAQLKPFQQQTPEGTGYVPNYLEGGLVLPLGPEENGNRQYISGFGSPAEEAFGRMHMYGGLPDVSRTVMDYLGNATPALKGPTERLFDRQFYSGRKLSDLRPQGAASWIGRQFGEENPNLLAQALANSPPTRFISSIDKLMDPRKSALEKAINLGTGARITDVDVDRQRAIETRDAIAEILKGKPHISSHQDFFVRPENIPKLTPDEIETLRLFSTQEARTAAWKKAQKQKQVGIRVSP
jgi:hypothetical protein